MNKLLSMSITKESPKWHNKLMKVSNKVEFFSLKFSILISNYENEKKWFIIKLGKLSPNSTILCKKQINHNQQNNFNNNKIVS